MEKLVRHTSTVAAYIAAGVSSCIPRRMHTVAAAAAAAVASKAAVPVLPALRMQEEGRWYHVWKAAGAKQTEACSPRHASTRPVPP